MYTTKFVLSFWNIYGGYIMAKKKKMLWMANVCQTYIAGTQNSVNSGYIMSHPLEVLGNIVIFCRENIRKSF